MTTNRYTDIIIYRVSFWSMFRLVATGGVLFFVPFSAVLYTASYFGSKSFTGNSSIIDMIFHSVILAITIAACFGLSCAIGVSAYLMFKPLHLRARIYDIT